MTVAWKRKARREPDHVLYLLLLAAAAEECETPVGREQKCRLSLSDDAPCCGRSRQNSQFEVNGPVLTLFIF